VDAFGCRVGFLKIDYRRTSRAVNLSREEAPGQYRISLLPPPIIRKCVESNSPENVEAS